MTEQSAPSILLLKQLQEDIQTLYGSLEEASVISISSPTEHFLSFLETLQSCISQDLKEGKTFLDAVFFLQRRRPIYRAFLSQFRPSMGKDSHQLINMVLTVLLNERVLTNILELVLNDIEIMKYCYLTTSPLLNTSYTTYITQSVDVLEKAVLFYISPNSVIDPSSPSPDDQPQRSLSPDQEPASALDTPTSEPLLVPIKRNHTKKKKVIQSTPAPKESESAISSQPRPSHSPTPSINTIKLPSADTLGLPIPDWSAQDKSVSADDVKTIDLTVLPLRRSPPIELVYDRAPLDLPSLLPQKLASHKDSPDAAVLTSLVVHSEQVGAIEPFPSQPSTEPRSTSAAARDTPRSQSASAEELTAARGSGDGGKEDETLFDAVDCSLFYSTLPRGNMFIVAPSTFTTVPFANTTIILPQATPLAE